jgi:hypothetical protein
MPEPRIWSIDGIAWIFVGFLGFFAVIGIAALASGGSGALPFVLVVCLFGVFAARCPYRVSLWDDGMFEVKAIAWKRMIHAREVQKIGRRWGETTGFRIYTNKRTIWFMFPVTDSYQLFKALESMNPSIQFSRV